MNQLQRLYQQATQHLYQLANQQAHQYQQVNQLQRLYQQVNQLAHQ
ncbi:hypothetical protein [Streptococcus oralis]|nr:hypothetical protein [Streptococcus oralis]